MKNLDNFANIGKAILTQSLGLQKNYIEVEETKQDMIDFTNSTCASCKQKALIESFDSSSETYQAALLSCEKCPNRIYTQQTVYKKIYHNEKNKYGYRPRLKTNAIKLLLLLHFYHPDQFGIIKNIDAREIAKQLKCDIKTVHNNLKTLKLYSYISFDFINTYDFSLCLNDYENYYLPANKGGRGFFVLSLDLLNELLNIKTLLSLRIHLRELMDLDNLSVKGPFSAISKTYKEIKRALPDYCKPGIIRNAINQSSKIFKIDFDHQVIRFEINEAYNAKKRKEDCFNQYQNEFESFMIDFNNTAAYMNVNNQEPVKYEDFFNLPENVHPEHFKLISLNPYEIEDLAKLAVQYSYDLVISAFSSIYKTYYLFDRKIMNLGGLIRTAINSKIQSLTLAV